MRRAHRAALGPRLVQIGVNLGAELALAAIADNEGVALSELARRLEVRPPGITKVIRSLERSGLVLRLADPADGRVHRVHLTPRGRLVREVVERRSSPGCPLASAPS